MAVPFSRGPDIPGPWHDPRGDVATAATGERWRDRSLQAKKTRWGVLGLGYEGVVGLGWQQEGDDDGCGLLASSMARCLGVVAGR